MNIKVITKAMSKKTSRKKSSGVWKTLSNHNKLKHDKTNLNNEKQITDIDIFLQKHVIYELNKFSKNSLQKCF